MKEYEFSGKTVEEAVEEGLRTLGLNREEACIEVLDEGKKGGLFSKGIKARVKVGKKKTDGERAIEFLDGVLERMDIVAATELDESGEQIRINVVTSQSNVILGHRGEVLDALQVITGAVANIGREEYERVVVDCDGYRTKREHTLRRLADKLADKAVRYGRKVSIEPMSPYERRIIHSRLADNPDVRTVSEGKEPYRYIVVVPNNLRAGSESFDARRGGRDRKGGFERRDRREGGFERREGGRDRRGGYDRREERPRASGLPRSKRQPYFGTYLGNSKQGEEGQDDKE